MSFLTALYTLLIKPLELIFEIIFSISNRIVHHPGLAIIFLSLAMNFLVLPLYKRADAMQEEERRTEEKIGPWQERIKKTFKGDERFMMLQAFYRENNYKPTDALKGSLSLMLEIPFFIAAYRMLSSLKLLKGVEFGPISDLGAPDGLIVIGALAINLLPILMTLINIVSSAIYTKGLPTKAKVQLYGMALIFLVFLYNSPAGLVFYWTLNNLFSLVKNIFYKLKNPRLVLSVISFLAGVTGEIWFIFIHPTYLKREVLLIIFFALLMLPLALIRVKFRMPKAKEPSRRIFVSGCLFLSLLLGLYIPSSVIAASPGEFITSLYLNPNHYLLSSFLLAAGTFIIWFGFFYLLASDPVKSIMDKLVWIISGCALVNFMAFGKDLGNLTSKLQFDNNPEYSVKLQAINLAVLMLAAVILFLLTKIRKEIIAGIFLAGAMAFAAMSFVNMNKITEVYESMDYIQLQKDLASFKLSKTGKNVIIIMMDRAMGSVVPYILNERPELEDQFDGFTYYPNTISFGGCTNFCSPALYGGYEYTPEAMNERDDEYLGDESDEALRVLPCLFDDNGYEVTVCDPPHAGFQYIPDLSIYDDHPDINAFNTIGMFSENTERDDELRNRNLFLYSLFKTAPLVFQPNIYNSGMYNDPDANDGFDTLNQYIDDMHTAKGTDPYFMDNYTVLQNLPEMTEITDGDEDTFLFLQNATTHDVALLQEPGYVPAVQVDNEEFDENNMDRFTIDGRSMNYETTEQAKHYQSNMAMWIVMGEWFDYLRENDVYDNTRIIIVGDHGRDTMQFDDMYYDELGIDIGYVNPLLLVKDFDSEGFTTDDTFMTIADVPTIAVSSGVIEDPVNPFTGNPITDEDKYTHPQEITFSHEYDILVNNGTTFLPGSWYSVHDDIFDEENWEDLGYY